MRGDWERETGQLDTALRSYERAVEIRALALGEEHADLGLSLTGLGRASLALERPREAAEQLERALALLDTEDADPIDRGLARFHLARALAAARAGESGAPSDPTDEIDELLAAARVDFERGGVRARGELEALEAWAAQRGQ